MHPEIQFWMGALWSRLSDTLLMKCTVASSTLILSHTVSTLTLWRDLLMNMHWPLAPIPSRRFHGSLGPGSARREAVLLKLIDLDAISTSKRAVRVSRDQVLLGRLLYSLLYTPAKYTTTAHQYSEQAPVMNVDSYKWRVNNSAWLPVTLRILFRWSVTSHLERRHLVAL